MVLVPPDTALKVFPKTSILDLTAMQKTLKIHQTCSTCLMDTTDPEIIFNDDVCNHCLDAEKKLRSVHFYEKDKKERKLRSLIDTIKSARGSNKYDCVIGLSGGVDSSYLAYKVRELGLSPLAVHLDNGWDSELAVRNIANITKKLNIDLHTHVIQWDEFKDLQLSFLRAGVVDLEMLSDNAIVVSVFKLMKKYNIRYFLIGTNIATESVMPNSWFYTPKYDSLNIKSIYRKYGSGMKLETYPMLNFFQYIHYRYFNGHNSIALLNFMEYNKQEALELLKTKLDYVPYPGKHYESTITMFYQAYILPRKYNIDKRKAHLSSLIASRQITKEQGLAELNKPLFSSQTEQAEAIKYFCKKLGLNQEEFETIMNARPRSHFDFSSYHGFHLKAARVYHKIRSIFN